MSIKAAMSDEEDADEVMALVKAVRPLFAGKPVHVQGAALADLLAMWLAGHVLLGDPKETKRMREHMLRLHVTGVRALIDINYKLRVEPQLKRATQ